MQHRIFCACSSSRICWTVKSLMIRLVRLWDPAPQVHDTTGDIAAQGKEDEVIRCDDPVGTLTFVVRLSKICFNHPGLYRVSLPRSAVIIRERRYVVQNPPPGAIRRPPQHGLAPESDAA
jgi:hypothetical protein